MKNIVTSLCTVTLNSKYLTSALHFKNTAFLKKAVMKKRFLGSCIENGKGFEQLSKYKKTDIKSNGILKIINNNLKIKLVIFC